MIKGLLELIVFEMNYIELECLENIYRVPRVNRQLFLKLLN